MIHKILQMDLMFERFYPSAHGYAGLVDSFRIAGNERMPPRQILTICNQSIRTSRWQPGEAADLLRRQAHAVSHLLGAACIIRAAAALHIQEGAAHIGAVDSAGVFVLKLDQAAASATIAEGFPLGSGHFFEGFGFPELWRHGLTRK